MILSWKRIVGRERSPGWGYRAAKRKPSNSDKSRSREKKQAGRNGSESKRPEAWSDVISLSIVN